MTDFLAEYYLWIKSFHIFFVIAWMAGIFYLPRLFVYHTKVAKESEAAQLFQVMESKLINIIMLPGMFLSLLTGTLLLLTPGVLAGNIGWIHLKVVCILGLIFFQFVLNIWRKQLIVGSCQRTEKFFRIINEVPSIILIIIIICVVVKPF